MCVKFGKLPHEFDEMEEDDYADFVAIYSAETEAANARLSATPAPNG